ncbi:MAG: hypothetical protein JXA82_04565 [Sedimentisphaerales bacterium]|nr:hypothetical protein [Sedimentisphaerales bacterium]
MNDFVKRMLACWSGGHYDLDKNAAVTQGIEKAYKKQHKKAILECYLRLAAAAVIIVYGTLGIKYNTGWYVTWALFTAIVGVNAAMVILLWYWQIHTKLILQKEMKELQLQIAELVDKKSSTED